MGLIEASDVSKLLSDPEMASEMAKAVLETPGVMETLADDIAEDLEDELDHASEFKEQIVDAAMANPEFRKRLALELVGDDDLAPWPCPDKRARVSPYWLPGRVARQTDTIFAAGTLLQPRMPPTGCGEAASHVQPRPPPTVGWGQRVTFRVGGPGLAWYGPHVEPFCRQ